MRHRLFPLVFPLFLIAAWPVSVRGDCIDYGDYLHRTAKLELSEAAHGVAQQGNLGFVAQFSGFEVLDISNPLSPTVLGELRGVEATDVAASGTHVFAVGGFISQTFSVCDVSNPAAPSFVTSLSLPDPPNAVLVEGNYAHIADGESGLLIVDISDPESPVITGGLDTPGSAGDVVIRDSLGYVADAADFVIINVSNPASPSLVGQLDVYAYSVAVSAWVLSLI